MALLNASSAIIAKAKSRYGKRLTDKDYRSLVKCGSVGEVVQYLKTYTHYARFLDRISVDIHRGNLENLLRERQFESFLTLCKYNFGSTPVTDYLFRTKEIDELMKLITLLSIDRPQEYLFNLPLYLDQHTDIPLRKLTYVRSYDDLPELLERTPYYRIIQQYAPDEKGRFDLASIEDALENESLSQLKEEIGRIKNKKERAELTELFTTLIDYNNYSRIMRLKKSYHMSNDAVRAHLLVYGSFTGRKLDRLLVKEDSEDVERALHETPLGKKGKNIGPDNELAVQGKFELCRRQMYFSANPEIVLLAYYILSETELSNLIAVIEGVRYAMKPENIYDTLIL